MEINQSSANQNLIGSEAQPQQTGSNRKLFIVVVIIVLLTAMLTGSAVYFWQKSANERAINNLEQKITTLEEQVSAINKEGFTSQPTPISTPSNTDDVTQLEEIYEDQNKLTCTSDSDCTDLAPDPKWGTKECWYKCPIGLTAGTPGSLENPGVCKACPPSV